MIWELSIGVINSPAGAPIRHDKVELPGRPVGRGLAGLVIDDLPPSPVAWWRCVCLNNCDPTISKEEKEEEEGLLEDDYTILVW